MKITTSKSILLSLLAVSTSTSSVVKAQIPQPEIVGGDEATRGDYPYFGKLKTSVGVNAKQQSNSIS
jgi:secreted trypsin-like serine protease